MLMAWSMSSLPMLMAPALELRLIAPEQSRSTVVAEAMSWSSRFLGAWSFITVNTVSLLSFWLYPRFHRDRRRRRLCGAGVMWFFNFLRLLVFGVALLPAWARMLRLADGPDEVHAAQIGRLELAKHRPVVEEGA